MYPKIFIEQFWNGGIQRADEPIRRNDLFVCMPFSKSVKNIKLFKKLEGKSSSKLIERIRVMTLILKKTEYGMALQIPEYFSLIFQMNLGLKVAHQKRKILLQIKMFVLNLVLLQSFVNQRIS